MTALTESARPGWRYRARRQWRRAAHWGSPGESYLLLWLSLLAVAMMVVMVVVAAQRRRSPC